MGAKNLEKPMENQQFYKPGVNIGTGSALNREPRGYETNLALATRGWRAQAKQRLTLTTWLWAQAKRVITSMLTVATY